MCGKTWDRGVVGALSGRVLVGPLTLGQAGYLRQMGIAMSRTGTAAPIPRYASLVAARAAPGHRGDAVAMRAPGGSAAMDYDGFRPRVPDRRENQAENPNYARAEKEKIAEISGE